MKKSFAHTALLLAITLFVSMPTFAQQQMKRGKQQMNQGQHTSMYDTTAVETITGTVDRMELKASQHHADTYGVHLMLATADGEVEVHLGPVWHLDNQTVRIQEGDEVSVTGARITKEGTPGLIAAHIQRGEEVLQLRDKTGKPLWRGVRRSK